MVIFPAILLIYGSYCENLPVVILHGLGGVQIDIKLNKTQSPKFYCPKNSDWFTGWFSVNYDILQQICFFDDFRLVYDHKTRRMVNPDGVETKIHGNFTSVEAIKYLDKSLPSITSYFQGVVSMLETQFGYQDLRDLFAFSYDFRDISDSRKTVLFFDSFKKFIETLNKPAIIITHSLGGVLLGHFLSRQSSWWKQQRIDSWYAISTPFGGSSMGPLSLVTGYTFDIPAVLVSKKNFRIMVQSFPVTYFVFPSEKIFGKTQIFVQTPTKNYTSENLVKQFIETVYPDMKSLLSFIPEIFVDYPPGVDMVCAYGTDVKTPLKAHVKTNLEEITDDVEYGDGDGTVNTISLSVCKRWINATDNTLEVVQLQSQNHVKILHSESLLNHMKLYIHRRNKIGPQTTIKRFLQGVLHPFKPW